MALTLSRLSRAACTMGLGRRALAHDGFAGLNIYKDPTKAPKELPDEEYPDWLWRVTDEQPTMAELTRKAERSFDAGGFDAVFEEMGHDELTRLFRLASKEHIRGENRRRAGGAVV